jgi:hypothetical protein
LRTSDGSCFSQFFSTAFTTHRTFTCSNSSTQACSSSEALTRPGLQDLPWAYIKLCLQHARDVQGVHMNKEKHSFGKHIETS